MIETYLSAALDGVYLLECVHETGLSLKICILSCILIFFFNRFFQTFVWFLFCLFVFCFVLYLNLFSERWQSALFQIYEIQLYVFTFAVYWTVNINVFTIKVIGTGQKQCYSSGT